MLVVSHRGPVSYAFDVAGVPQARRGAGGMASGLRSALQGRPATWVAAAMGEADRAAARLGSSSGVDAIEVHLLELDENQHHLHYDVVSNEVLWFLHHGLIDATRRPWLDRGFQEAWSAYETVNEAFARAIAEEASEGETVLVHDYHLSLVPGSLRAIRPDLAVAHFTHTPFSAPDELTMLPDSVARAICASMAGTPCGFHSERWAQRYRATLRSVLGPNSGGAPAFVSPLAVDEEELMASASSPGATAALAELDEVVGDRKLILRVDRVEPSKNIVRGFAAYDLLLEERPDLRGAVVFVALLHPSRETLTEYVTYRREVERAAAQVNERWSSDGWQPVVLEAADDHPKSMAAFTRYDVLLVNPLRDGLNLVAKEAPLVNRRQGVLCLSPTAGAFDELGEAVLAVHPFDLVQTARALGVALSMEPSDRSRRAALLQRLCARRQPGDWLTDLLAHAARG
ncbi:MAG: alpha,alpha-trehalose-phosphate synthase (UDP-forming) [Acidimicrobiia bacterium]